MRNISFSFILLALAVLCLPLPTHANDRMAGSGYSSTKKTEKHSRYNNSTPSSDIVLLESYGLLKSNDEGSLGIDIWDNSQHKKLYERLAATPTTTNHPYLNDLLRRILLTANDARLINRHQSAENNKDLLTLRLKKLIEMGNFTEAATLYKQVTITARDDDFTYTGVLALLHSEQTALACLETMAAQDVLSKHVHGPNLISFCHHTNGLPRPEIKDEDGNTRALSPFVKRIVDKKSYNFRPANIKHIEKKSSLELALLKATGRFNSNKISLQKIKKAKDNLSPFINGILLHDKNLPDEKRFYLILQRIENGNAPLNDLITFYKNTGESDATPQSKDWRSLSTLYKSLQKTALIEDKIPLLETALTQGYPYGTTALLPFAVFLPEIKPDDLSTKKLVLTALKISVYSDTLLPYTWNQAWHNATKDKELKRKELAQLYLVAHLSELTSATKKLYPLDIKEFSEHLNAHEKTLVKILYENLDSETELHNIRATEIFNDFTELTFDEGYVIPLKSIMKDLKKAVMSNRSGEVFLVAIEALHEMPPHKINGDTLNEILNGFIDVGLKKEAQLLAKHAMLASNNNDN